MQIPSLDLLRFIGAFSNQMLYLQQLYLYDYSSLA